MFFRFSDAAKRDTDEFASIIQRINERPKPPTPKKPDPNWDNYQYGLSAWKEDYLEEFDVVEKVVKQLAPGDAEAQRIWLEERTHTELGRAFIETIMFKQN